MEDLAHIIAKNIHVCDSGPWMLPEEISLPTGSENGAVFVIGVGGSRLRLTEVIVSKDVASSKELFTANIPNEVKDGNLFSWCAIQIKPLLDEKASLSKQNSHPIISISWSFPISQGKIISMGKAFSSTYNGKDLLELFNAELSPYMAYSATHDGASSLVAGIHRRPLCAMALTVGTGVNINLRSRQGKFINTEISMLGRHDTTPQIELPTEVWDLKGHIARLQPFEARIGGLHLGEMASNALAELINTEKLWEILISPDDTRFKTVDYIVTRAASLLASAIYGVYMAFVSSTSVVAPDPIEIVYTGGVIFEPQFRNRLEYQLDKLSSCFPYRFNLVPLKYGSEVGAAIVALTTYNCES